MTPLRVVTKSSTYHLLHAFLRTHVLGRRLIGFIGQVVAHLVCLVRLDLIRLPCLAAGLYRLVG